MSFSEFTEIAMYVLDDKDRALLAELQRDSRQTVQQLAAAVGLSATPCWKRVKDMEAAGVIRGYTALVDGDPDLRIDNDEILEAGWFTREQVRATGEWGNESAPIDDAPGLRGLPGTMSIARQLINAWLLETD